MSTNHVLLAVALFSFLAAAQAVAPCSLPNHKVRESGTKKKTKNSKEGVPSSCKCYVGVYMCVAQTSTQKHQRSEHCAQCHGPQQLLRINIPCSVEQCHTTDTPRPAQRYRKACCSTRVCTCHDTIITTMCLVPCTLLLDFHCRSTLKLEPRAWQERIIQQVCLAVL